MTHCAWKLAVLCACFMVAPALAADAPLEKVEAPTAKVTPLGVRQQRVERMMDDLDRTFKNLAQALEKTEPERAARLIKALEESKQMLIQNRMGDISKLLNDTRLDVATDEQKRVLADLEKLLAILLKEDSAKNDKLEEALRLEKWKQEINRVLEEEKGHRQESGKIANKEQTLANLAARIAALKALIARQQELAQQTESSKGEASRPLTPLADKQQALRQETQALAKQLGGKGAQSTPAGGTPSGAQPDVQPGGKKPSRGEPSDAPGSQPGSGQPGGQSSSGQQGGAKSGRPGGSQQGGSPEKGPHPLDKAAGHQQSAENNLQQGKPKGAAADEQQAVAEMQKALADLEREQQRIATLPKDHHEQLAKQQDTTTERTGKLNEDMKKGAAGGQSSGQQGGGQQGGGQQSGGQQSKPTPGQESVEQAQQSMQHGADDLRAEDPSGAAQKQDQAIRNLEDALKEIEKRLAQLREQLQLDKLARLETRFREMLDRQKKVTAATGELEQKRGPNGQLKRTDRLQLASLSEEERALAAAAQLALEIILEDGTSVVFPEVVAQVRDDFNRLGELLDGQKTDSYTQLVEKDSETTLEELIAALQKAQQKKKGGGGGGSGGGGQDEPLLPGSAELKLLKAAQLRVNRRTVAFTEAHKAAAPDELAKKELSGLATRQQEIAGMTERIIERN